MLFTVKPTHFLYAFIGKVMDTASRPTKNLCGIALGQTLKNLSFA